MSRLKLHRLKKKNGKRKFKRMLSFLFVEGSLIKKSSFEEFNPVFIAAEYIVCLKCNEGSNVFAEFLGTFFTLWPRKVRF